MSLFNPEIPFKQKPITKHPWEKRIKAKYSGTYKYAHNSTENPVYPTPKPEQNVSSEFKRVRFIVIGNRVTKEFIYCFHVVKGLYKYRKKLFEYPIIRGVNSVEWPKVLKDLKDQFGSAAYCLKSQVAVLLDNELLGGDGELKNLVESKYFYQYPEYLDYYKEGVEQFYNYIKSSGRPCAFLHICINDMPIGPLIFMLYADIAPLTCQNFIMMCESTKGGYSGTPIHRIVQDGWIQCGGFGLNNYDILNCENFIVPHDRRGVLCMANDGRDKDCSTQFFVLLQPAPWMRDKYVAFGQLIEGERTLKKIEDVPTWYESPLDNINIHRSGVFNMECQWRAINKSANNYISGHIEDLVQLGNLFYEAIIEKLYAAIDEKIKAAALLPVVEVVKEVRTTKRGKKEKASKPASVITPVNNDFDVEEYEDYKTGEEGDSVQQGTCYLADETPKSSRILERPYYLPLTDVPYPGEVESTFNLQRLLRGDYCLETDLILDVEERKHNFKERDALKIPDVLLDALFECFDPEDNISDNSLDSDDEKGIRHYIKKNVDNTSFAGPIVKKMANIRNKYQLFENVDEVQLNRFLTDEELRLFRVAAKEVKSQAPRKRVSISRDTALASHTKINRRPTRFIHKEDMDALEEMLDRLSEQEETLKRGEDRIRMVRVESTKGEGTVVNRRQTGYVRLPELEAQRTSALLRLYNEVTLSDEEEVPTLKSYRPLSEHHQKNNYNYLTNSPLSFHDDSRDKMFAPRYSVVDQPVDISLNLQHGNKLNRKLSSDYANTLTRFEHQQNDSLRSVEYAKQRPSLTVGEYKLKNQKYQDEILASTKKKID